MPTDTPRPWPHRPSAGSRWYRHARPTGGAATWLGWYKGREWRWGGTVTLSRTGYTARGSFQEQTRLWGSCPGHPGIRCCRFQAGLRGAALGLPAPCVRGRGEQRPRQAPRVSPSHSLSHIHSFLS